MDDIIERIHQAYYGWQEKYNEYPTMLILGREDYRDFLYAIHRERMYPDPKIKPEDWRYNGMKIIEVQQVQSLFAMGVHFGRGE